MKHKILTIFLALFFPIFAHAQLANYWYPNSNNLQPIINTYGLAIPKLGSTGNPCVSVSSAGVFATTTCGGGGGTNFFSNSGASTTLTTGSILSVGGNIAATGTLNILGATGNVLANLTQSFVPTSGVTASGLNLYSINPNLSAQNASLYVASDTSNPVVDALYITPPANTDRIFFGDASKGPFAVNFSHVGNGGIESLASMSLGVGAQARISLANAEGFLLSNPAGGATELGGYGTLALFGTTASSSNGGGGTPFPTESSTVASIQLYNYKNSTLSAATAKIYNTAGQTGDSLEIASSSNTVMAEFNDNGWLGIGSSTPGSLLAVGGNAYFGGNVTATGTLTVTSISTSSFVGPITEGQLNVPAQPTTSSTIGGSMATGTYYYVVTAVDNAGKETSKSVQSAGISISGMQNAVFVDITQEIGALEYNVYRTTTSGVYGANSFIGTITGNNTSLKDTLATPTAGTPPLINNSSLNIFTSDPNGTTYIPENVSLGNFTGVSATLQNLSLSGSFSPAELTTPSNIGDTNDFQWYTSNSCQQNIGDTSGNNDGADIQIYSCGGPAVGIMLHGAGNSVNTDNNILDNGTGGASFTSTSTLTGLKLTNLSSTFLAVDASGNVIATTTSSGGGSGNSAWTIGKGLISNATSTDYVSIGTSSPFAKLYVVGTLGSSSPIFTIASTSPTGSSSLLTVLSNGNVGIASSSPLSPLSVVGNVNIYSGNLNVSGPNGGFGGITAGPALSTFTGGISISGGSINGTGVNGLSIGQSTGGTSGTIWTATLGDTFNGSAGSLTGGGLQINPSYGVQTGLATDLYIGANSEQGASSTQHYIINAGDGTTTRLLLTSKGLLGLGLASSTPPYAVLSIQQAFGSSSPLFTISSTTSAGNATSTLYKITTDGHIHVSGSIPSTSCSGTCVLDTNSSDQLGSIAIAGVQTSVTLTFSRPYGDVVCMVNDSSTSGNYEPTSTSTTAVVFSTAVSLGTANIFYQCWDMK